MERVEKLIFTFCLIMFFLGGCTEPEPQPQPPDDERDITVDSYFVRYVGHVIDNSLLDSNRGFSFRETSNTLSPRIITQSRGTMTIDYRRVSAQKVGNAAKAHVEFEEYNTSSFSQNAYIQIKCIEADTSADDPKGDELPRTAEAQVETYGQLVFILPETGIWNLDVSERHSVSHGPAYWGHSTYRWEVRLFDTNTGDNIKRFSSEGYKEYPNMGTVSDDFNDPPVTVNLNRSQWYTLSCHATSLSQTKETDENFPPSASSNIWIFVRLTKAT
jgi:hypothetical protein